MVQGRKSERIEALRKSRAEAELLCEALEAHGFKPAFDLQRKTIALSYSDVRTLVRILGDNFPIGA